MMEATVTISLEELDEPAPENISNKANEHRKEINDQR